MSSFDPPWKKNIAHPRPMPAHTNLGQPMVSNTQNAFVGGRQAYSVRGGIASGGASGNARRAPAPKDQAPPVLRAKAVIHQEEQEGRSVHTKSFSNAECFEAELWAYQRLAGLEVTPGLAGFDREAMTLSSYHYGKPFHQLSAVEQKRQAPAVFDMIARMNAAGVIHRDMHARNVLIGPRGPRCIDFEWAHEGYTPLAESPDLVEAPRAERFHHAYPSFWDDGHEYAIGRIVSSLSASQYQRYLQRLRHFVGQVSGYKTGHKFDRDGLAYQSIPVLGITDDMAQRKTVRRFEWMALAERVQGKRVVDLGSNLGSMSVMCAQAGATQVDGIELDGGRVALARLVAGVAGVHDRTRFHNKDIMAYLREHNSQLEGAVILSLAVDAWVSDKVELYDLLAACKADLVVMESNQVLQEEAFLNTFKSRFDAVEILGSTRGEDAFKNHRLVGFLR